MHKINLKGSYSFRPDGARYEDCHDIDLNFSYRCDRKMDPPMAFNFLSTRLNQCNEKINECSRDFMKGVSFEDCLSKLQKTLDVMKSNNLMPVSNKEKGNVIINECARDFRNGASFKDCLSKFTNMVSNAEDKNECSDKDEKVIVIIRDCLNDFNKGVSFEDCITKAKDSIVKNNMDPTVLLDMIKSGKFSTLASKVIGEKKEECKEEKKEEKSPDMTNFLENAISQVFDKTMPKELFGNSGEEIKSLISKVLCRKIEKEECKEEKKEECTNCTEEKKEECTEECANCVEECAEKKEECKDEKKEESWCEIKEDSDLKKASVKPEDLIKMAVGMLEPDESKRKDNMSKLGNSLASMMKSMLQSDKL